MWVFAGVPQEDREEEEGQDEQPTGGPQQAAAQLP